MTSSKVNEDVLADEVWDEVVGVAQSQDITISLEDFLNKAASVVTKDNTTPHVQTHRHGHGGRAKRRAMEETIVDKATLQKQRRMIKNRESAARSRERKQAYTVELESLVTHLEEEHARLIREEADRKKQRYDQLMKYLIPVVEKRKPRRMLRRVNSAKW